MRLLSESVSMVWHVSILFSLCYHEQYVHVYIIYIQCVYGSCSSPMNMAHLFIRVGHVDIHVPVDVGNTATRIRVFEK